jgi:hypothetical protein
MDQTFYKAMQTAPSWPVVDIVVRDWRATETKDRRLWFRPGRQRVGAMLTPPASPLVGPMTYSPAELDAFWDAHLSRETCGGDSRWIGKRRLAGILDVLAKLGAADPRYAARYGEAAALATRVRRLDGEQMNALRRAAEEHWKARQAERDRQPDVVSSLATPP